MVLGSLAVSVFIQNSTAYTGVCMMCNLVKNMEHCNPGAVGDATDMKITDKMVSSQWSGNCGLSLSRNICTTLIMTVEYIGIITHFCLP